MYELNRTHARRAFKDLLGQANHFLITVLVGLDGVRSGKVDISSEFRTSWNPQNVKRSAERSRVFVLDLALIRAIDALDTFMMMSARKPSAIADKEFRAALDGTGRSVARRLDVFDENLPPLKQQHKAALLVAIQWRNQRVHSLSDDKLEKSTFRILRDHADWFASGYSGLTIGDFISNFKAGEAPTFKEAASVIRLTHEAVAHYDEHLLEDLPVERYLKVLLGELLSQGNADPSRAIKKTWGHPSKKETKVIRLLRMIGVNETPEVCGREVPKEFVERLVSLECDEVLQFIDA
ncbi:hypothetical protein [Oceanicola granulosus]|uniref:hypothetical protein n=1 Tax=Oceanicola granulosus TaxID=252302 RepID=UPI0012E9A687|nr:hypothetical protein [Oceanicola granulosus]